MSRALHAIVFDFDGVIANSEPLHLRAYQRRAARGRHRATGGYYARYSDTTTSACSRRWRAIAVSPWDDARWRVMRQGRSCRRWRAGEMLFPGAAATSSRAAAAAVPIAIASGALTPRDRRDPRAAGTARLFARSSAPATRAEQAVAGPVPAGVRAPAPATGGDAGSRAKRGHRGFALGARIGARRRVTLRGGDQQLSGATSWRRSRAGRRRSEDAHAGPSSTSCAQR